MGIRRCGLDDCTILEHFQSSVKYFQVGRYFISDRKTEYPLSYLTEGQKDMILPPFISDRRTKGHDTHPQPLPKGGECRRLGEIRPALELARFQNKVEKERPETSQPKATPWELFATNIRPEWAKELLFRSLPMPLSNGGCHSFATFGATI